MFKRLIILCSISAAIAVYLMLNQPQTPVMATSHWLKLDAQGRELTAWQVPWHCVVDTRSGLTWQNLRDDESIHDGYWSYSWFDGETGVANRGDCYFEEDRCDTLDLIIRVNAAQLCGKQDWRLPSANELAQLLYPQTGKAYIDESFFSSTQRGDYWTSDAQQPLTGIFSHLKEGALAVNFGDGSLQTLPYRNAAFVRLVSD